MIDKLGVKSVWNRVECVTETPKITSNWKKKKYRWRKFDPIQFRGVKPEYSIGNLGFDLNISVSLKAFVGFCQLM